MDGWDGKLADKIKIFVTILASQQDFQVVVVVGGRPRSYSLLSDIWV